MSSTADPTFIETSKKQLRRILNHWTPLTVTLGFLAAGTGILSLFLYTSTIDRVDLFISALDAKAALAIWLVMIAALISTYALLLTTTTLLYAQAISLLDNDKNQQARAAIWLLIPYIACSITFLLSLFGPFWKARGLVLFGAPATATLATYLFLLIFSSFRKLIQPASTKASKPRKIAIILALGGLVTIGALASSVAPILLISEIYSGEDTPEAHFQISFISISTILLSLAPVIVFYLKKGSLLRRALSGILILPLPILLLLLVTPGAGAGITYITAAKLEIRQTRPARFLLNQDIQLTDLDNRQWRTNISRGRVEITAFQLFSFGDALLLCPVDLIKLDRTELRKYSALCISTQNSRTTRKPLKLRAQWNWQQFVKFYVNDTRLRNWSESPQLATPITRNGLKLLSSNVSD